MYDQLLALLQRGLSDMDSWAALMDSYGIKTQGDFDALPDNEKQALRTAHENGVTDIGAWRKDPAQFQQLQQLQGLQGQQAPEESTDPNDYAVDVENEKFWRNQILGKDHKHVKSKVGYKPAELIDSAAQLNALLKMGGGMMQPQRRRPRQYQPIGILGY